MKASSVVLFALALLWISLHPTRPPSSVDSVYYLTGDILARSTASGAEWPPLYRLILSIAPYPYLLNALCYAACVVLVYASVGRYRLALTAALFTPAFTLNFVHVWSEPLFILLTAAFFVLLCRPRCYLAALSILAALALMQRYSGVVLVGVGAAFILWRWGRWQALAFVLLPTICLLGWLARNVVYGLLPMGQRFPPAYTWLQNSEAALSAILVWVLIVLLCVCTSSLTRRLWSLVPARHW